MKTKTPSKRLFPRSFKPRIPTDGPPPWMLWPEREIRTVKYRGHNFKAGRSFVNQLAMGKDLELANGYFRSAVLSYGNIASDSYSCAYQKISPHGRNAEEAAMFAYWLDHSAITRGTVAFLTEKDGAFKELGFALMRRGFRLSAVNRSNHAGNYPVWLFVHPGDAYYKKYKNKRVYVDADLLAASVANHNGPRNPWDTARGDKPAGSVPDANKGTEGSQGAPDLLGRAIPAGRIVAPETLRYGTKA